MPIKWTPEIDQILLLKILETSSINLDGKAISEAWPTNHEKPTPRAITERIFRIRATAQANGTSTSTPKKPNAPAKTNGGNTNTPSKLGNGTSATSGGKRKRMIDNTTNDDDEDFKLENNATTITGNSGSPSKKKAKGAKSIKAERAVENDNPFHSVASGDMDDATPYGVEDLAQGNSA